MRLLNLTLIKLTIGFIIGILLGYYFNIPVLWSLGITSFSLIFLSYFLVRSKKQIIQKPWFGRAIVHATGFSASKKNTFQQAYKSWR